MGTFLILGVCVVFLVAMFTAGYEDNPNKN
ncbi:hypothetical protein SAMN05421736_107147 [Evansella caseinilytica]|uniref:Uncharacterized protein n=1 Tax=Evansella caseinilytica TaxID=1503961 RepID=A0A1H3R2D4_9BACI|nr:hypothetical protein SAMN05421736_107147 [Evansella caseinilytica]